MALTALSCSLFAQGYCHQGLLMPSHPCKYCLCLGPYGGPKRGAVSYERGTPVNGGFSSPPRVQVEGANGGFSYRYHVTLAFDTGFMRLSFILHYSTCFNPDFRINMLAVVQKNRRTRSVSQGRISRGMCSARIGVPYRPFLAALAYVVPGSLVYVLPGSLVYVVPGSKSRSRICLSYM